MSESDINFVTGNERQLHPLYSPAAFRKCHSVDCNTIGLRLLDSSPHIPRHHLPAYPYPAANEPVNGMQTLMRMCFNGLRCSLDRSSP